MRRGRVLAATLVGLLLVGSSGTGCSEEPEALMGCVPLSLVSFGISMGVVGVTLAKSDDVHVSASFETAGYGVMLWHRERADDAADWHRETLEVSTEYQVIDVAGRDGGRVLYVAGVREPDGEPVLERWTLSEVRGSRGVRPLCATETTPAVAPRGEPAGELVMRDVVLGGELIPVEEREPWRLLSRESMRLNPGRGIMRSLAVDPEGRFLLAQFHDDGDVYQFDLTDAAAEPERVASGFWHGALGSTNSLSIEEYPELPGRTALLMQVTGCVLPEQTYVLLRDEDNDAVFESVETLAERPRSFLQSPDLAWAEDHDPYGWR